MGEVLYGESSKILKIFTEDLGIISVMSRGCRRIKNAFHEASNTLIYANFDISYKENAISTLTAVDIIKVFKNIQMNYKDLERKLYAFSLVKLTNQVLTQKQISPSEIKDIYNTFLSALEKIDDGFDSKTILDIVMLKYLDFLGVKPSIDACSNCGSNTNIVTFSSSSYGYVCDNCYNGEKMVSKDSIKMLRMLYYVDIGRIKTLNISEDVLNEIDDFLNDYYEEHTGIYLKKSGIYTMKKIESIMNLKNKHLL